MRVPSLTIELMTSHTAHTLDIDAWVRSIPRKVPDRSDCSVGRCATVIAGSGQDHFALLGCQPSCQRALGSGTACPPATPTVGFVGAEERVAVRSILRALVDFQKTLTRNAKCRRIPPPTQRLSPEGLEERAGLECIGLEGRHPLQQSAHCTCAPGGGPCVLGPSMMPPCFPRRQAMGYDGSTRCPSADPRELEPTTG